MTDAEREPEMSREERLYIRIHEILDGAEEQINRIPNWIPALPSFCRGFIDHAKAAGQIIHRRRLDEEDQNKSKEITFVEAFGDALVLEWQSFWHYGQGAYEALPILSAIQGISRFRQERNARRDSGPDGPTPPVSPDGSSGSATANKEKSGDDETIIEKTKSWVKEKLDKTDLDERAQIEAIEYISLLRFLLKNDELKKIIKDMADARIETLRIRIEEHENKEKDRVESQDDKVEKSADTEKMADEAVKRAEKVINKTDPKTLKVILEGLLSGVESVESKGGGDDKATSASKTVIEGAIRDADERDDTKPVAEDPLAGEDYRPS